MSQKTHLEKIEEMKRTCRENGIDWRTQTLAMTKQTAEQLIEELTGIKTVIWTDTNELQRRM